MYYTVIINQLRAARRLAGMTQEAVDHAIGVTGGLVAKWETGVRVPSAYFLMCWCEALGVILCLAPQDARPRPRPADDAR